MSDENDKEWLKGTPFSKWLKRLEELEQKLENLRKTMKKIITSYLPDLVHQRLFGMLEGSGDSNPDSERLSDGWEILEERLNDHAVKLRELEKRIESLEQWRKEFNRLLLPGSKKIEKEIAELKSVLKRLLKIEVNYHNYSISLFEKVRLLEPLLKELEGSGEKETCKSVSGQSKKNLHRPASGDDSKPDSFKGTWKEDLYDICMANKEETPDSELIREFLAEIDDTIDYIKASLKDSEKKEIEIIRTVHLKMLNIKKVLEKRLSE